MNDIVIFCKLSSLEIFDFLQYLLDVGGLIDIAIQLCIKPFVRLLDSFYVILYFKLLMSKNWKCSNKVHFVCKSEFTLIIAYPSDPLVVDMAPSFTFTT